MILLRSVTEKAERGRGVCTVSLSSAREIPHQLFSAMHQGFFRLQQALPLASAFTRAFMQTIEIIGLECGLYCYWTLRMRQT